jgi:hypothetical protein
MTTKTVPANSLEMKVKMEDISYENTGSSSFYPYQYPNNNIYADDVPNAIMNFRIAPDKEIMNFKVLEGALPPGITFNVPSFSFVGTITPWSELTEEEQSKALSVTDEEIVWECKFALAHSIYEWEFIPYTSLFGNYMHRIHYIVRWIKFVVAREGSGGGGLKCADDPSWDTHKQQVIESLQNAS